MNYYVPHAAFYQLASYNFENDSCLLRPIWLLRCCMLAYVLAVYAHLGVQL